MSKGMVKLNQNIPAAIADLFQDDMVEDLTGGVTGGFAILGIRGSKWRVKYQGDETLITNDEGEPKPSIDVVFLKANSFLSKTYYAGSYTEGDDSPPDCASSDGVKPDAGVPNPQAENCATCPHNQWGSRITDAGKKAKECADTRRVAVVPAEDIANTVYGGPMLLRIPAASLADLALFSKQLASKGIPYNAVVIRLGFDSDASYPKLTFKAKRMLTEDDAEQMREHFVGDAITRVLESNDIPAAPEKAAEAPSEGDGDILEDDAPEPPKKTTKKKVSKKKAAKKAVEESAAEPKEEASSEVDNDLDAMLADLENLD